MSLSKLVKDLWNEQSRVGGRSDDSSSSRTGASGIEESLDLQRCLDILCRLEASLNTTTDSESGVVDVESEEGGIRSSGSTMAPSQLSRTLDACSKTFRLYKRQNLNPNDASLCNDLLDRVAKITTLLKGSTRVSVAAIAAHGTKHRKGQRALSSSSSTASPVAQGEPTVTERGKGSHSQTGRALVLSSTLPESVADYLIRLKRHDKELYKNPPVLPPCSVIVTPPNQYAPLPRRNAKTGRLTFGSATFAPHSHTSLLADFCPNQTPAEILRGGAFGGTYFRPIHSAVTNVRYDSRTVLATTVDEAWIAGLDIPRQLTSTTYRPEVNKFKVKCGGSLGMWESSGWISDADPYGWFQWYCRFYQGRRSSDDDRQIARWKGVAGAKGRFKSQLCNKILAATNATAATTTTKNKSRDAAAKIIALEDVTISPVIRQTLFHWGLVITDEVLHQHKARGL